VAGGAWAGLRSGSYADQHLSPLATPERTLTLPELDLCPYLECLQRCREQFPGPRIISGVELGEPHWHGAVVARLLSAGQFDRVLGSLHCLPLGGHFPGHWCRLAGAGAAL
jgi:histidinol-phosphatase (PHP family)